MRYVLSGLFALLFWLTVYYLIGSLIAWNLNPAEWNLFLRIVAAICALDSVYNSLKYVKRRIKRNERN